MSGSPRKIAGAFTIVEVLVVITIILVLAGLILATSGYAHNKAARSRAEVEIAGMSAALENYKADNGVYPSSAATTSLDAKLDKDSTQTKYQAANLLLYEQLSGDLDHNRSAEAKSYFTFKDNQLNPQTGDVTFIKDPFGNSYGYSTINQIDPSKGYNPTFDVWSTANSTDPAQWIKNW
jgi:type II secretory pathway pseudopilin PulG